MEFIRTEPTLANYWRSIILFGQNTASYKFALAKALIESGREPTNDLITLEALSEPFSRHMCEHLAKTDKQGTRPIGRFLEACRQFNAGQLSPVAAGVYLIWKGDQLIYCGMSGREIEKNGHKKKFGLVTRLNSHASGRLSGDQFCVYVANRLVVPNLQHQDLELFASGELTLDKLTKSYIHNNLEYQYVIVESSAEAYALESEARSGKLVNQKPLLNPR